MDNTRIKIITLLFVVALSPAGLANPTHTLEQLIELAWEQDPWLKSSSSLQQGYEAQSVASSAWANPQLQLGVANLAADSFEFDQEPMTQLKLGVSQKLPRGKTRSLKQSKWQTIANQQSYLQKERKLQITRDLSSVSLDIHRVMRTIELIESDRNLFEQLVDVAESKFTSALNSASQGDLLRAQSELTRLDERLLGLNQQLEMHKSTFSKWLPHNSWSFKELFHNLPQVPEIINPDQIDAMELQQHPKIQAIKQGVSAKERDVQISQQGFKPQWSLNAGYGYRQDQPSGASRADFLSVGVSLDIPLFNTSATNEDIRSQKAQMDSLQYQKEWMLQQMNSEVKRLQSQLSFHLRRQALIADDLLLQLKNHAQATLTAYTNDEVDFSEVMRSRIAVLSEEIELLNLQVETEKIKAKLNYFFPNKISAEVVSNTGESS